MAVLPRLVHLMVCDAVGEGPDGRKTLYGVTARLAAERFPWVVPQLAVYSAWTDGVGAHEVQVRVLDAHEQVVYETADTGRFALESPFSWAEVVLRATGVRFAEPGVYTVRVWLNDQAVEPSLRLLVDRRGS